jgi:hypothetical protein
MAQTAPTENATLTPGNAVMITILLKHDQSRSLSELMSPIHALPLHICFAS